MSEGTCPCWRKLDATSHSFRCLLRGISCLDSRLARIGKTCHEMQGPRMHFQAHFCINRRQLVHFQVHFCIIFRASKDQAVHNYMWHHYLRAVGQWGGAVMAKTSLRWNRNRCTDRQNAWLVETVNQRSVTKDVSWSLSKCIQTVKVRLLW